MSSSLKNKKHKKKVSSAEGKEKESQAKIRQLEKEKNEFLAYAQKCKADFSNYKKEENQRIDKLIDYEKTGWFLELLRILDHFELARQQTLKHAHNPSVFDGFFHIQKSLEKFLREQGLEEIPTQIGKKFDPNFEEVVDTETKEGEEGEDGEILEIVQKGYKFRDRIIRPARVKVSIVSQKEKVDNEDDSELDEPKENEIKN